MIEVTSFRGRSVGVFGLARSGLSAIESLISGGARVFAWDDRESGRQAAAGNGAQLENWDAWPWSDIDALILSPGVPFTHPEPHPIVRRAIEAGAEVIGDVELFARTIRPSATAKGIAPIVAITGTNGKSTTTALIAHVLKACGFDAQAGGNIGRPALDLVAAQNLDDLCSGDLVLSNRSVARADGRRRSSDKSLTRSPRPPWIDARLRGGKAEAACTGGR